MRLDMFACSLWLGAVIVLYSSDQRQFGRIRRRTLKPQPSDTTAGSTLLAKIGKLQRLQEPRGGLQWNRGIFMSTRRQAEFTSCPPPTTQHAPHAAATSAAVDGGRSSFPADSFPPFAVVHPASQLGRLREPHPPPLERRLLRPLASFRGRQRVERSECYRSSALCFGQWVQASR